MTTRNLHALLETLSGDVIPVDVFWGRYFSDGAKPEVKRNPLILEESSVSLGKGVKDHLSRIADKGSYPAKERMRLLFTELDGQNRPLVWLDGPDRKQGAFLFIAVPLTLRSSKKFFETFIWLESVMDNSSFLCCLIDREGRFLRLSRKGCEILGLEREKVRDRNIEEFLISPSRVSELAMLSLRTDNTEIYLTNGQGREILCIGSIIPFYDRNDEVLYYYIIVTDFSHQMDMFTTTVKNNLELSNMNDFLKKSQTALLKAEKLSSIGMLGSGLAHEINNPLSFIINDIQLLDEFCGNFVSFGERLKELSEAAPPVAELISSYDMAYYLKEVPVMLGEMGEGMARIQRIVESLKSFSGLENSGDWNYADVNTLLEEMLVISRNEYKYDVELEFLPGKIPSVHCFIKELNQAFLSVFLNSIQAIRESGRPQGEKGSIVIRTEYGVDDDTVRVLFADNGVPFPESIHERLLDPFYTRWKEKGGSGLGLALVNDIVSHKHKGRVEFRDGKEKAVILIIPVNIREIQGV